MGKSHFYRFERFEEVIYPQLQKLLFGYTINVDKDARSVKFYRQELGRSNKMIAQFYPIGNKLELPGGKWIRENSFDYLTNMLFGKDMPELTSMLYIDGLPKVKEFKVKEKNQIVNDNAEKLIVVGSEYSEVNLKTKKTLAIIKMISCLKESGIPFIEEFPVVIKRASSFDNNPKLYLLDFYIPPPFNLIIEVDGGYHTTEEMKQYDKIRDASIRGKGLGQTIRFKNEEILSESFNLMRTLKSNHNFQHAILRARHQRSLQDF